ncbi:MAG: hypothetical protein KJ720_04675 [Proteobacteria bacterium]|nr:hypothetical protein [Pseudomonadota bacterium]MBU1452151.1 hypothetical protein [Pseudomonadota bacterium]MBU2467546.1 hypothetical protein [Pseudomonadota bacterium]MBU2518083.1 hypothetical protein [Pseudomonadota bacterium]
MPAPTDSLSVSTGDGRLDLSAQAHWVGPDLVVMVTGGELAHVGAVAMAAPRPSLADPAVTSATASVFTYPGHKEDRLAQAAAELLCARLKTRVVVTAGCHWDNLDQDGIRQVSANGGRLAQKLLDALLAQRGKP